MPYDPATIFDADNGGLLTQHTIGELEDFFAKVGHRPSPAMWSAMRDLSVHLESMALGLAAPKFFLRP
jgi:hypothetical protein